VFRVPSRSARATSPPKPDNSDRVHPSKALKVSRRQGNHEEHEAINHEGHEDHED
jgi:hypothetical protein